MRSCNCLLVTVIAGLLAQSAFADAPTTAPSTAPSTLPVDSPEAAEIRRQLVEWDKTGATISLEQLRKFYYSTNDREAAYMDRIAHENWEECKTEKVVRDKWGAEAQAKFAHLSTDSTLEDDLASSIKVDGDHATVSWDIKDFTPLPMIKIDQHWLVDGHQLYVDAIKDDPNMETDYGSNLKLLRQARADIAAGKFDDADTFIADYKYKTEHPPAGN